MCGASSEQKEMWASQSTFMKELTDHYTTVFGKQQNILDSLTSTFKPILEAGPNQRGFSDAERSTLDTQAIDSTSKGYAQAKEALGEEMGARGGDATVASGADSQLSEELAATAEAERADLGQKITMADYDTGHRNWQFASDALGSVAAQENPNGAASVANTAGEDAAHTANDIAAANNSIWQVVGGALGGIAGQAVGGWTGKH